LKYPITVTVEEFALRRPRIVVSSVLADAWRFGLRHWGIFAALAVTFIVHAPTLRYFFDGDDFVVFGSIEHAGVRQYLLDTLRMQDIVPNWRPLTAVLYAAEWEIFGLDARGARAVNLGIHLVSLGLLYALVLRITHRAAIGAVSALIFGISGAHFDTVTYVTALPHVLATALILGSLLAIVAYAQDGERSKGAYVLSFELFVLAFLANEGAFVYAPLIVAAYALYAQRWRHALRRLVLHGLPFAAVAGGWLAFYQTCTCGQLKFDGFTWGPHVVSNYAVYLSWLLLPIKSIPADPSLMRWLLATAVVAFVAVLALRGPHIAKLGALGIVLALLPFVPVQIWTASRYSYSAVAFFAPLLAIAGYALYARLHGMHPRMRLPANALALLVVAVIASLYGWQTYAQDARSGRGTDRWLLLVNELKANYETVPPGTTIYIVEGPWSNPMEQYTWVPSVARAVYGDAAAFDLPREAYRLDPPNTENALFLEWTREGLRPIAEHQVVAGR
jgi:hypothetical protein